MPPPRMRSRRLLVESKHARDDCCVACDGRLVVNSHGVGGAPQVLCLRRRGEDCVAGVAELFAHGGLEPTADTVETLGEVPSGPSCVHVELGGQFTSSACERASSSDTVREKTTGEVRDRVVDGVEVEEQVEEL